jgi:hypothetical protein
LFELVGNDYPYHADYEFDPEKGKTKISSK